MPDRSLRRSILVLATIALALLAAGSPAAAAAAPPRTLRVDYLHSGNAREEHFALERVATFPDGIIHLVPEPDEPFRKLTARLAAEFPEHPPYEGRYGDVAPHLTLDLRSADVTEASTLALLDGVLPARCRATRLDLAWYEPNATGLRRSWPLA